MTLLRQSSKSIFQRYTDKFGDRPQVIKTIEECGELIQALCKWLIATSPDLVANDYDPEACVKDIVAEAVQVDVMLSQLRCIFSNRLLWADTKHREMLRLRAILEDLSQ